MKLRLVLTDIILYSGSEQGVYTNSEDVGDTLTAEIPVSEGQYIVVTAYNSEGESGYSNEVIYQTTPKGVRLNGVILNGVTF